MAGARPPAGEVRELERRIRALLAQCDPRTTEPATFWGAQFDHGLAWVAFPDGRGGFGARSGLQPVVDEALRAAGAPGNWDRNPAGIGVAGPALVSFGTEDQARRYLRPLFTGAEIWCQLYTEPGAGSDLADVATSAVPDGNGWILTGRKVWITMAHVADWGLVLARTDPHAPKHRGITCFVIDMATPGVEVRPLRQMTGDAEFDEVVLDGVRVPDQQRLGDVGQGWEVATATLAYERQAIGDRVTTRSREAIGEAVRLWQARPDKDPALRDRLVGLWVEAEVARLTSVRARQQAERSTPGPEGAIAKLAFAELNQRIHELCLTLLGPAGMLYGSYEMTRPTAMATSRGDVAKAFLRSRANTIEAGTSEILRTVLAQRALGLPAEPRVDVDRPWSEVARG